MVSYTWEMRAVAAVGLGLAEGALMSAFRLGASFDIMERQRVQLSRVDVGG